MSLSVNIQGEYDATSFVGPTNKAANYFEVNNKNNKIWCCFFFTTGGVVIKLRLIEVT